MAEHWGVLSVKDDIQQKDNGIYGSEENEFQPRWVKVRQSILLVILAGELRRIQYTDEANANGLEWRDDSAPYKQSTRTSSRHCHGQEAIAITPHSATRYSPDTLRVPYTSLFGIKEKSSYWIFFTTLGKWRARNLQHLRDFERKISELVKSKVGSARRKRKWNVHFEISLDVPGPCLSPVRLIIVSLIRNTGHILSQSKRLLQKLTAKNGK